MKYFRIFTISILVLVLSVWAFILSQVQNSPQEQKDSPVTDVAGNDKASSLTTESLIIPERYSLDSGEYVGQTFNNCGPATLSMAMSLLGKNVSQSVLASSMRPFNNPLGGVDDKSIFAHEFVKEAEKQGFTAIARPNGSIDLIKALISNDIPVVVRTWLNDEEDIGHFRMVTGYDSVTQMVTYQDSYYGPNQKQSESEFLALWKPFNYGYILVYPAEKQDRIEKVLGGDWDETVAWKNALSRSEKTLASNKLDSFARFNLGIAQYHLGLYDEAITSYEAAVAGLPPRMLWYQPEPIYAYQKNGEYDKAILLVDSILQSGNIAYSELYQIKGEIYVSQGNKVLAREMFEKAIYYNSSFQPARDSLNNL